MLIKHRESGREQTRRAAREDTALNMLRAASPAEIDSWVDANVNSLADAKGLFKKILRAMSALASDR